MSLSFKQHNLYLPFYWMEKKLPFFCSGPVFSLMQQHIHHQTDLPHRHLIALIKYSTPRVLMCFSFSQCYLITGNSCDDLHINYYICNYPASLGQLHTHRHMHKRASFFTDEVNPFNYILTTWVVFSYLVSLSVSQSLCWGGKHVMLAHILTKNVEPECTVSRFG